ncbi:MAG: alginate lyase family protein [Streptosporangiaceae bacterium]
MVLPSAPAAAATPFKHPGVLVSKAKLDRARKNIKKEPFKSAFAKMKKHQFAKLTYKAKPYATVECGPYDHPNIGCSQELYDATAAYTQALMWYITKNPKYGYKSMQIMDAWSAKLKQHKNANSPLQQGWAAIDWAKAGEIMRYSVARKYWPHQKRFATMLRTKYLPGVVNGIGGTYNGNWELVMADATISIAVYLDDHKSYDKAVALWRKRVPAHFYLKSDGAVPHQPPGGPVDITKFWNTTEFASYNGISQEFCRDLKHTSWGLSAATQLAETARIQGGHLFTEQAKRLTASMEFAAKWQLANYDHKAIPANLCGGRLHLYMRPVLEVGYAAYKGGHSLPYTRKLMLRQRPAGVSLFQSWETLTNS